MRCPQQAYLSSPRNVHGRDSAVTAFLTGMVILVSYTTCMQMTSLEPKRYDLRIMFSSCRRECQRNDIKVCQFSTADENPAATTFALSTARQLDAQHLVRDPLRQSPCQLNGPHYPPIPLLSRYTAHDTATRVHGTSRISHTPPLSRPL